MGREPWLAEGEDVSLIRDILPGTDGSNGDDLVAFKGAVYLSATDGTHGYELWNIGEVPPAQPPAPKVAIASGKVTLDARGRLKVRLTCSPAEAAAPCRGTLTLKTARKIKLGGGKKSANPDRETGRGQAEARQVNVTANLRNGATVIRVVKVEPKKSKPKKKRNTRRG